MRASNQWRRSVINLGGPALWPPFSIRQPSFFPSLSWTPRSGQSPLTRCQTLMHFMQSNSLIKSTLMFNVLPGTEISAHAEFSHCRQNWYYGLQATKKWEVLVHAHLDPTLPESGGSGPQDLTGLPPQHQMIKCRTGSEDVCTLSNSWRNNIKKITSSMAEIIHNQT